MLRREFIKATGTVLAASALPATAVFAAGQATATRTILPINRKWRYHPAKVEGAHLPTFNDAIVGRIEVIAEFRSEEG